MTRLLIHVEGETEETFVNELLAPHLTEMGYSKVSARLLGNSRLRQRRGGIRAWTAVRKDVLAHLRGDPGALATTMVDYYALPRSGPGEWPGRDAAARAPCPENGRIVQEKLLADVCMQMGDRFDPTRFIPFVMLHEFEALLFSDCDRFAAGIGREELAPRFKEIRDAFASPEEIDDSPLTAPSKRIEGLMPGYQKPLHGNLAALSVGLAAIRSACPHFDSWIKELERRAGASAIGVQGR